MPFRNSQGTSHSMTTPRHHAALIIWMHKDVETVEYVWCDRATHRGLSSVCSRLADGGRTLLLLATAAPELSSLSRSGSPRQCMYALRTACGGEVTAGEEAREAQKHFRMRPNMQRYSHYNMDKYAKIGTPRPLAWALAGAARSPSASARCWARAGAARSPSPHTGNLIRWPGRRAVIPCNGSTNESSCGSTG